MQEARELEYFTYDDYVKKEGRWELINGEFWDMSPAPTSKHQWIAQMIWREIEENLTCKKRCKTFISPIDWVVDKYTIIQPDVAIFCIKEFVKNFTNPPLMAVEVLSKSSALKDRNIKFKIYEQNGVKYLLFVEPNSEFCGVFELLKDKYQLIDTLFYKDSKEFSFKNCKTKIDFSNVFEKIDE